MSFSDSASATKVIDVDHHHHESSSSSSYSSGIINNTVAVAPDSTGNKKEEEEEGEMHRQPLLSKSKSNSIQILRFFALADRSQFEPPMLPAEEASLFNFCQRNVSYLANGALLIGPSNRLVSLFSLSRFLSFIIIIENRSSF